MPVQGWIGKVSVNDDSLNIYLNERIASSCVGVNKGSRRIIGVDVRACYSLYSCFVCWGVGAPQKTQGGVEGGLEEGALEEGGLEEGVQFGDGLAAFVAEGLGRV